MDSINSSFLLIGAVTILFVILLFYFPIGLWFAAMVSGVKISIFEIILMKFRKSPIDEIIRGLIVSEKAGLNLNRDELEAFSLTGGNIQNVVNGMVAAKKAGLKLSFKNATKADVQEIDILDAVRNKMKNETEKK